MHNGMVRLEGEKMAKSVGNIFLLHEALAAHGRDALLAYFCAGHYRQPIAYSEERLAEAARSVARIREAGRKLVPGPSPAELAPLREAFFAALADDFNTPKALAVVFDWVREANRRSEPTGDADLRELLGVLALDGLLDADAGAGAPDEAAQELLARREAARAARDFAEADRLRDDLAALGWEVRDSAEGPTLVPRG
jgi:cysteinyl-tRNA synthetase